MFKQWFIDFEFPNENGQPYKSSGGKLIESELGLIPEGWEVKLVSEIADTNSNSYSKKDSWEFINYLDTSNITDNRIDTISRLRVGEDKIPSRAKRKAKHNDIVFSTVRPNQNHFGIIKNPKENLLVSTGFTVISSKIDYVLNEFIYLWLTQDANLRYLQTIAESSKSTYPSIKASHIKEMKMVLSPKDVISKVKVSFEKMFDNVNHLDNENKSLSALRDTLLPKLMSGEIRVNEVRGEI